MSEYAPKIAAFSVSELNRQVKMLLESHFDSVRVEGEIGDFTAASSGHWYFTLKDADAQVRCAMFRGDNQRVKIRPSKGDSVRIRARVSLYPQRGEFQLICQHMEAAGEGALQRAFDALKEKLKAEGLFDPDRKQVIVPGARRVGVITSASGAVIHDIVTTLARRSPSTAVYLFPVPVQGTDAAPAICDAIRQANNFRVDEQGLDVLIVGRGGGSLEDLWAFNEESVARSIAGSALPVVSAVGHEVDFTIADFVADQRAATPTAAAELISLDEYEWLQRFDNAGAALRRSMRNRLRREKDALSHLKARLRHPGQRVSQRQGQLRDLQRQLKAQLHRNVRDKRVALEQLAQRLQRQQPGQQVVKQRELLALRHRQLKSAMQQRLQRARQLLEQQHRLLTTLGPENTLQRGYAIVTRAEDNALVSSSDHVKAKDAVTVRLAQGQLTAEVTATDP